jgi:DNA modification methylase
MSLPPYFRPNTIYCGDCEEALKKFPDECVDLIYMDPPFFSNKHYEVIWGDGYELRAFEDRWKGGVQNYIAWMRPKLVQCQRVLKKTGSIYLHCDWHANAHLRILMDELFGESNFQNEIIWHYGLGAFQKAKGFPSKHDTLLLYSKTGNFTFNKLRGEPTRQMLAKYCHTDEKGRYMASYGKKYYLKGGKPVDDVWDIPTISATATERLGYPTQKPERLLERIIQASSNPTDIVLDPFCGCGTAVAVAHRLGRRWIGIDVSPTACNLMAKRMSALRALVQLVGMPMTEEELKKIQPFDFQNWVVQRLFGRVSPTKSSDLGIDGYTFDGYPIQVKQSEGVGRNVVDNFETAMRRKRTTKGTIVAFSFGKGAYEEVARALNQDKLEIQLVTVAELLKGDQGLKSKEEEGGRLG